MAYENLKQEINSKVYENFRQEITGQRMNDVLIAIVNTLGRFYAFGGVVTPTTEVVVGEEKVFFLATQTGTYPNLGNLSVAEGELFVLFTHDTSWAKIVIDLTKLMTIINNAVAEEKERAEQVEQALLDKTEGIQRVSGGITIIDGIEIGALKNIAESAKIDAEDAKMEAQQTSIKTVEVTTDGNLLIVPKSGAPITFSPLKLAGVIDITGDIEDLEVGDNLVEAINAVFNMAVSADSTAQAAKGAADTALAEAEKKVERVELIYHHDANNITLVGSETPLTFAQIAAFVEDPTKFVTMYGYDGDFLLPQYYDGGALTFTGLSVFEDYTASHRVIINLDDEIKNEVFDLARKSDLAGYAKGSELTALKNQMGNKQDIIPDLAAIRSGAAAGASAVKWEDAELAFAGKYATEQRIDEVERVAKGAAQSLAFKNYAALVSYLASHYSGELKIGQNLYIETIDVPDLWVKENDSASAQSYTYTTDEQFIEDIKNHVAIFTYELSFLETGKVDLSNYYSKAETDGKLSGKTDNIELSAYLHEGAVLPYPASYSWGYQVPQQVSFRKDTMWYIAFCLTRYSSNMKGVEYAFFGRSENSESRDYTFVTTASNPEDEWYKLGLRVFSDDLRDAIDGKVELIEVSSINEPGEHIFPYPAIYCYYGATMPHTHNFIYDDGTSYVAMCLWHLSGGTPASNSYLLFERVVLEDRAFIKYLRDVKKDDPMYETCQKQFHDDLPAKVDKNAEELTVLQLKVGELSDLETTDKTSIVNAINEVAQGAVDNVFRVTYGVTTFADIIAARNAGKIITCDYNALTYILSHTQANWLYLTCADRYNNRIYAIVITNANQYRTEYVDLVSVSFVNGNTATTLPTTPVDNTIYNLGEVANVVVASLPTSTRLGIVINFTSGATATQLSYPANSKWNQSAEPTIEANKSYQITILDGVWAIAEISTLTQA